MFTLLDILKKFQDFQGCVGTLCWTSVLSGMVHKILPSTCSSV